jgi:hypothetical protein
MDDIILDVIVPSGKTPKKLEPNKNYTGWEIMKRYM